MILMITPNIYIFSIFLASNKLSAGAERPVCTCGLHTVWSRERFSMCNNRDFWNVYSTALKKVIFCRFYTGNNTEQKAFVIIQCNLFLYQRMGERRANNDSVMQRLVQREMLLSL